MKTIIQNGIIIDGTGRPVEKGDLVVTDGKITDKRPCVDHKTDKFDKTIEADGKYVLPGFINCHLHLTANASRDSLLDMTITDTCTATIIGVGIAERLLKAGFTTVRDMGSKNFEAIAIRDAIKQGMIPGPNILAAGQPLLMSGGHFLGLEVDGVDACLSGARNQIKAGADLIKVVATGGLGRVPGAQELTFEEMNACFVVARMANKTCAAHAHGLEGIKDAIRAGVTSIEHGTMIDEEAMDMMVERGTYLVPTFAAYKSITEKGEEKGVSDHLIQACRLIMEQKMPRFEKAIEKGVIIAFGTDGGSPINFHEDLLTECRCMIDGGMTPIDVISALTRHAARLLRLEDKLGTLELGKQSDIVFLDGNPLEDIDQLKHVVCVMKNGEIMENLSVPVFEP